MSDGPEKVEKKEGAAPVEHINLKVVGNVSASPLSIILYSRSCFSRTTMKSFSKLSVLRLFAN
jgi:hypothetical protein